MYQYCPKMWRLRSLELAGGIQKQTILECQNGLVLSNTRVPVSGTWRTLFLKYPLPMKSRLFTTLTCYNWVCRQTVALFLSHCGGQLTSWPLMQLSFWGGGVSGDAYQNSFTSHYTPYSPVQWRSEDVRGPWTTDSTGPLPILHNLMLVSD